MEKIQYLNIDGRDYPIHGERNVLQLARNHGIDIPSLCYHPNLSIYGACRLCVVDVEGMGVVSSCTLAPQEGLVIKTRTAVLRQLRRTALELILANHDSDCTTCRKNTNCRLQELSSRLGVTSNPYQQIGAKTPCDASSPALVRDPGKCILCGNCVRACTEFHEIGVLEFSGRGHEAKVTPAFGLPLGNVECVNCGQCAAVCPVGAIYSHSYNDEIWAALNDPTKVVVAQIAPAVRIALGEEFGLPAGQNVLGKMVSALRELGFDHVYDTSFAADLTTVEEATEILGRIQNGGELPVFTSCCPAWVTYAEYFHGDMLKNLSSCKSPQGMLASVLRKALPGLLGCENKDLVIVSVMPCTAKKYEIERKELSHDGIQDMNYSMTTSELAMMIKEASLDFLSLEDGVCDDAFGLEPGSGVIFATSGGVTEAVLRYTAEKLTGKKLDDVRFEAVRGEAGIREANLSLAGTTLKLCQVHGLANAKKVIADIASGEKSYHVVEVMACPNGCVNGGGQPFTIRPDLVIPARTAGVYARDEQLEVREPQDNQALSDVYKKYIGEVGGHEAHELLHTHYCERPKFRE
ncbi:MAG: [FeFe] hydrogenase, group A [Proteobacteria bacterium]|nr:[FeFe] hydrogenase, group A [Pseudomonadota bacterium]